MSFGTRRSTKRNSPQRCAARKPSAMAPQSAVAADAQPAAASHWCGRRSSNATPIAAKADCAASSVARSTATLAVAGTAPVPRRTSRWTRTNSPPTCATGRRAFTESRIHRIRTSAAHPGRLGASISGAQPKAANRICGRRRARTASMPQPAAPSRAKISAGSLAATRKATAARPTRRVMRADQVTRRPVRPVPPRRRAGEEGLEALRHLGRPDGRAPELRHRAGRDAQVDQRRPGRPAASRKADSKPSSVPQDAA